jgi:hypothetical protein
VLTPIESAIVLEFGNPTPQNKVDGRKTDADFLGPSVTTLVIPPPYARDLDCDLDVFTRALADSVLHDQGITNGLDEALLTIAHPSGFWESHSASRHPSWVHSDTHPEFADLVARYHQGGGGGTLLGRPADYADTHWTRFGPPGSIGRALDPSGDIEALLVNCGRDNWAQMMGGGAVGYGGTAGTPTSTTMPINAGTPWSVNQWASFTVVCGSVFGIVLSNTSSTLTIDQWYTCATPGGAAGTTPAASSTFAIIPGSMAAWFGWLSSSSVAPLSTDTTITSAITTASGGLIPKICPYAHSAGTNTFTFTPVYTANASDSLPVTVYQAAFCKSINTANAATIVWKSCINVNAVMGAIGDQLTLTETVTGT